MENVDVIHLESYGLALAIIVVTIIIAIVISRLFQRMIERATTDLNNDPTNYHFLRRLIVTLIYLLGIGMAVYTIPSLRGVANSLLASAGVFALAAGFASQQALSNIISGMFIVVFKPFRINDRVTLKNYTGVVEDITLRHTVIRDFQNRRIIIPNAVISDEVIVNADFGEDKICKFIEIGISYDSDIDIAKQIIEDEALKHTLLIDNRTEEDKKDGAPQVPVRVLSLGDSSVNLRAWCWTANQQDSFVLSCDLYEAIKKRFDTEGIEIPFPHHTLVHKNLPNEKTS